MKKAGRLTIFAKKLRGNSTDTEQLLWKYLRAQRFVGFKFRRQEPIGKYIVDFVCYERRVIVECDGSQHLERKGNDARRDQWFQDQGYRVLRFWDNEVLRNTKVVLEVILRSLEEPPSP